MIYLVTRTSSYDKQPIPEAKVGQFDFWHTRTVNEEEFNKRFSEKEGLWRSKGTDHSVTNDGFVTRKEGKRDKWFIEISTLEELHSLIIKYGDIVISSEAYGFKIPEIEFYDTYRE